MPLLQHCVACAFFGLFLSSFTSQHHLLLYFSSHYKSFAQNLMRLKTLAFFFCRFDFFFFYFVLSEEFWCVIYRITHLITNPSVMFQKYPSFVGQLGVRFDFLGGTAAALLNWKWKISLGTKLDKIKDRGQIDTSKKG